MNRHAHAATSAWMGSETSEEPAAEAAAASRAIRDMPPREARSNEVSASAFGSCLRSATSSASLPPCDLSTRRRCGNPSRQRAACTEPENVNTFAPDGLVRGTTDLSPPQRNTVRTSRILRDSPHLGRTQGQDSDVRLYNIRLFQYRACATPPIEPMVAPQRAAPPLPSPQPPRRRPARASAARLPAERRWTRLTRHSL